MNFDEKKAFRSHIEIHVPDISDRQIKCKVCGNNYKNRKYLRAHMRKKGHF